MTAIFSCRYATWATGCSTSTFHNFFNAIGTYFDHATSDFCPFAYLLFFSFFHGLIWIFILKDIIVSKKKKFNLHVTLCLVTMAWNFPAFELEHIYLSEITRLWITWILFMYTLMKWQENWKSFMSLACKSQFA